jgi:hypothetical protein
LLEKNSEKRISPREVLKHQRFENSSEYLNSKNIELRRFEIVNEDQFNCWIIAAKDLNISWKLHSLYDFAEYYKYFLSREE